MVLVGPAGTGKTTLGLELSARTRRPFVDLDAVAEGYYEEMGWSIARLNERIAVVGRVAAETEWEPARAHAVVQAVAENPGAILALGAGHTSFTDEELLCTVRTALSSCPDVVRILPSLDRNVSLTVLRERCNENKGRSWVVDGYDFLAHWLDDRGSELVATRTIYTDGETPAETAARLIQYRGRDER